MNRRPRFFVGQVLGVDDLNGVIDYADRQLRQHHLLLHGVGVVRGLEVRPHTAPASIVVSAGVAIDPLGRLLSVDADTVVPLGSVTTGSVVFGATERLTDPLPTPSGDLEYRSIETVAELRVVRRTPTNFLVIGRIRRGAIVTC